MAQDDRRLWRILVALILVTCAIGIGMAIGLVKRAHAQEMRCGDEREIIKVLTDKYQEAPVAGGTAGMSPDDMQLFVSPEGTWTILYRLAPGQVCVGAAGQGFHFIEPPKAPSKES